MNKKNKYKTNEPRHSYMITNHYDPHSSPLHCCCPGEDGKLSMRGKGGFYADDPEEKATDLCTIGIVTTNLPRRHNKRSQLRIHLVLGTGLRRAIPMKNVTMPPPCATLSQYCQAAVALVQDPFFTIAMYFLTAYPFLFRPITFSLWL